MSLSDKYLRDSTVPFRADWFGNFTQFIDFFENNDHIGGDLRKLTAYGYVNSLGTYFPKIIPIRITRPEKGQIVEAALTLRLIAPSNGSILILRRILMLTI